MYTVPTIPWTPTDLELLANKYNNMNNERVWTKADLHDTEDAYCCYQFVSPGEIYRIYGRGNSGTFQLYGLANSNRYIVEGGTPGVALNTRTEPLDIVIPEGVAILVVNLYQYNSATDKVQKIGHVSEIGWEDGSENSLYLTYQAASNNQTVLVSSDVNFGATRTKTVTFSAGNTPSAELTVSQTGGAVQHTITLNPSSYDNSDYSYASVSYPSRAYTDETSTTYCQIGLVTGEGAETWMYFGFDTSSIPAGALIDEVSCRAKTASSSTNTGYLATRKWQLFSGTTAKGESKNLGGSGGVTNSVTGASWTRAELDNIRIRIYVKRGTQNTTSNYWARFFGATLTVKYTV